MGLVLAHGSDSKIMEASRHSARKLVTIEKVRRHFFHFIFHFLSRVTNGSEWGMFLILYLLWNGENLEIWQAILYL
jgi:hypothetical protein